MKSAINNTSTASVLLTSLNELTLGEKPREENSNGNVLPSESTDLPTTKYMISTPPLVNPWRARADTLKNVKIESNAIPSEAHVSIHITDKAGPLSGQVRAESQSTPVKSGNNLSKKSKKSKQQSKIGLNDGHNWPTLNEAMNAPRNVRNINLSKLSKTPDPSSSKVSSPSG